MAPPFKSGDLVICIDASACPEKSLHAGSIYIIREIHFITGNWLGIGPSPHEKSRYGVSLIEISDTMMFNPINGRIDRVLFAATRFEKIENSLDSIITNNKIKERV